MPIQAADLPNITILATGGTIAGSQKIRQPQLIKLGS